MTIEYPTLTDEELFVIQIQEVIPKGLIFLWVATGKLEFAMKWMSSQGFKHVENIIWIKQSNEFLSTSKSNWHRVWGDYLDEDTKFA